MSAVKVMYNHRFNGVWKLVVFSYYFRFEGILA